MPLKFDEIKKLHQKKYRSELGYFLVEGEHLVLELEKAARIQAHLMPSTLWVTAAYEHWPSLFSKTVVNDRQMAQLSDTKTPPGIIAVVPLPPSPAVPGTTTERAIYLNEIQDPGNLGTILRSLAWFGQFRCLLSPNSVDPYNPKVVRASMGAIFHVPLELDVVHENLTERFKRIACLDMQGEKPSSPAFKNFDCYVFGNEARGLPKEQLAALQARPFSIGGSGAIESLNLASAVNICVYELTRD
jgi:TrmH family RNA methyltransferase